MRIAAARLAAAAALVAAACSDGGGGARADGPARADGAVGREDGGGAAGADGALGRDDGAAGRDGGDAAAGDLGLDLGPDLGADAGPAFPCAGSCGDGCCDGGETVASCPSDCGGDLRLSAEAAPNAANPECALGGDGRAHVVWSESSGALLYARSAGTLFDAPVVANAERPDAYLWGSHPVAADGEGRLYVVYESTEGGFDLFFLHTLDGVTFDGGASVVSTSENGLFASIAVPAAGDVYVAYSGLMGGRYDPFFTRDDDVVAGAGFSAAFRVQSSAVQDDSTAVAVLSDGAVLVAFETFEGDLFVSRSTTGGASFTVPVRVNDEAGAAEVGHATFLVADQDDTAFIAWKDTRSDSEGDLYYDCTMDRGASFTTDLPLASSSTRYQEDPSLAPVPGGGVVAVWQDLRSNVDYDVRWRRLGGDGLPVSDDAVAGGETAGDQHNPCVAVRADGRLALFAWRDFRDDESSGAVYARFVPLE